LKWTAEKAVSQGGILRRELHTFKTPNRRERPGFNGRPRTPTTPGIPRLEGAILCGSHPPPLGQEGNSVLVLLILLILSIDLLGALAVQSWFLRFSSIGVHRRSSATEKKKPARGRL
jgi:hypothetical protein